MNFSHGDGDQINSPGTPTTSLLPRLGLRHRHLSGSLFPTTRERMSVNALCAPTTSVLKRLTSAPTCTRPKNAIGILCMCSNSFTRRLNVTLVPIVAARAACPTPITAVATPINAISAADVTTACALCVAIALFTMLRNTSGVATPSPASARSAATNTRRSVACGRANAAIRVAVLHRGQALFAAPPILLAVADLMRWVCHIDMSSEPRGAPLPNTVCAFLHCRHCRMGRWQWADRYLARARKEDETLLDGTAPL